MKRRDFIRGVGSGAIAASGVAATASVQAGRRRYRWKLVTTWPPNFPIFQTGVKQFAKDVRRMSRGAMTINVFAGGELIPALQTFDAVSQGTIEMGHGAAYYWAGKIPAAQFFTAVPFGLNAQGMNAWFYGGGGHELWQALYAPHGLMPFPMGNTGVQMGGWFRKRIDSLADLKGLKMRIPGLGGKVIAKAGVNPVLLSGGEIYTALERGTIDATEWVGPYHDLRLGLYRAAKYYYYPGWHEPGPALELTVNRKVWDDLPKELQLIISTAAMAANLRMLSEFEARNLEALEELTGKHKVDLRAFPDEVLQALRRFTTETLQEEADKDAQFAKIHKAYSQFMTNNNGWRAISEAAYARALAEKS